MTPHDQMLEQSVLFGLIYNHELAEHALDRVKSAWFYSGENQQILNACTECHATTSRIDPITVVSILQRRAHIGAAANVTSGAQYASSLSNIDAHLDTLEELYIKRRVVTEAMKAIEMAEDPNGNAFDALEMLSKSVTSIQDDDTKIHSLPISEVLAMWENSPKLNPFNTGDPTLDGTIYAEAGRHPGQMEVTIAHSGHGKTRYAIYKTAMLALNGVKTHWFQLEDYGHKTAQMFKAMLPESCFDNVIITDSIFEIERIKRESRISARDYGVQNIVVDYVQNLSADKRSRAEDVEYISRQLTRMAIDLQCQVHLMSQLTIQDAQRKKWNLEPRAADVRWSRQLQQDAHIITSVFRPERIEGLYDDSGSMDWNGNLIPKGSVFIKQLKSRYGEPCNTRYHMIDTANGLVDAQKWVSHTQAKNNEWRGNPTPPALPTITEDESPF